MRRWDMTNCWLLRCLEAHSRTDQRLFGIVQGGLFPELRRKSAEFITGVGFPGYSIGGLSVGEPKQAMYDTVELTTPMLPADAPRYLMGVGSPEDLVECVARGIDMFDCVLPTRIARNGSLFVKTGRLNITAAFNKRKYAPIEDDCDCYNLPHILGGVCASPLSCEGASCISAGDDTQPALHPAPHGRDARRDSRRRVR